MVPPDRLTYLFNTYHAALVRYVTRRVGDQDWAEEVAQETFVRAMRQETIVSERSWLFAVATNLVRDDTRRDARQREKLERLHAEQEGEQPTDIEANNDERDEQRARARSAIALLAERDRDALLMKEEGLSYEEIASALELSVGSVGTTLSRARRRLMEAYESLEPAPGVRSG